MLVAPLSEHCIQSRCGLYMKQESIYAAFAEVWVCSRLQNVKADVFGAWVGGKQETKTWRYDRNEKVDATQPKSLDLQAKCPIRDLGCFVQPRVGFHQTELTTNLKSSKDNRGLNWLHWPSHDLDLSTQQPLVSGRAIGQPMDQSSTRLVSSLLDRQSLSPPDPTDNISGGRILDTTVQISLSSQPSAILKTITLSLSSIELSIEWYCSIWNSLREDKLFLKSQSFDVWRDIIRFDGFW